MSFARWQPYYTDRELELDRRIHAFGLLLALIDLVHDAAMAIAAVDESCARGAFWPITARWPR